MENTNKQIMIAGGGYAGLCLALFLTQAGIETIVYEAYSEMRDAGAALTIAPNGMNVLANIGLDKEVIKAGQVVQYYNFRNHKGKLLAHLNLKAIEKFGQPFVLISRSVLHRLLYEKAISLGISIMFNKKLSDIKQSSDSITAIFEDGSSEQGSLLIGADGIHSAVRKAIFNDQYKEVYTGFYGAGGIASKQSLGSGVTTADNNTMTFTFGLKGFFGYGPMNEREMLWWCTVEADEHEVKKKFSAMSEQNFKKMISDDYSDFHKPAPKLIANSDKLIKTMIYDIPGIPEWYKGRVLVIGDAAHAVSPTSGVGASLALEDAMMLGKLLSKHSVDEYQKVFTGFQSLRKPRTEKIRYETNKRNSDKKVLTPFQAGMRDWMMLIFLRLFGFKSMDWQYNYKIDQ
jgi:2-polyprenyl-6-methoxyphenol hydroxylase-like FAD-dependent oxidoreductase